MLLVLVVSTLITGEELLRLTHRSDIASISAVEGKNWRHGDIEDVLKTVSCIRHHKWNSMMIKRVYFGYVLLVFVLAKFANADHFYYQELATRLQPSHGRWRSEEGPARDHSDSCLAPVIPRIWLRHGGV